MAAIFFGMPGRVMAITTDGVAPASMSMSGHSRVEQAVNAASDLFAWIGNTLTLGEDRWETEKYKALERYYRDTGVPIPNWLVALKNSTFTGRAAKEARDIEDLFDEPVVDDLNFDENKFGFSVGVKGGFSERVQETEMEGDTYAGQPPMRKGEFQIFGVAFRAVCDDSKSSPRHGLEAVLFWYNRFRVSNHLSVPFLSIQAGRVSVKIGSTEFRKCWCVGVHFEPMDANFDIWNWELRLIVAPTFYPRPLVSPSSA
jgi:hypothetical protein